MFAGRTLTLLVFSRGHSIMMFKFQDNYSNVSGVLILGNFKIAIV